jgi:hypothetical protein
MVQIRKLGVLGTPRNTIVASLPNSNQKTSGRLEAVEVDGAARAQFVLFNSIKKRSESTSIVLATFKAF